jgi:uncharacterized Fe-S cluster protein YjdI
METSDNQFTNGEITVTYEPKKCIHAEKCCSELAEVFRSSVIPWIDLDGAETEKIIAQIGKCPSGALRYAMLKELVNAQ